MPVDSVTAASQLAVVWETDGPNDHPFEQYYRKAAEGMVRAMAQAIESESGQYDRQEWNVRLGRHTIVVTPDRVLIGADGIVHVQRIRTGRQTKSELDKPIYALLRLGARAQYPGRRVSVEAFYLATGERVVVPVKDDDKLLQQYVGAIEGIERGDFHPEPNARRCPNCQCYFMCGG